MELNTLEISPAEAEAKLNEYVEQLASERTAEDEAILAGYRAAKRGLPVILLTETIKAGGFFDNGLPKLAVVRADAKECFVHKDTYNGPEALVYADGDTRRNNGALLGLHTVRVPVAGLPTTTGYGYWRRAKTIVPTIPPNIRPRRTRLPRRHILWEVEEWAPVPPIDPALLRHIRGDLWAVEACWSLTELERSVLTQRARP